MQRKWVFLVYGVPSEPSAPRVYVWRKLQRLYAVSLQAGVWVLPATEQNREHFQWLATEITDLGGEASVWQATALLPDYEEQLVQEFSTQVEPAYNAVLEQLDRLGASDTTRSQWLKAVPELQRLYMEASSRDHLTLPLGQTVRARLRQVTEELHKAKEKEEEEEEEEEGACGG